MKVSIDGLNVIIHRDGHKPIKALCPYQSNKYCKLACPKLLTGSDDDMDFIDICGCKVELIESKNKTHK